MVSLKEVKRVSDTIWEVPRTFKPGMLVPARLFGTESIIREMDDAVLDQISNVAGLPGIVNYSLCMPDGHFGYGFPIGGVAAMDVDNGGVISPGGIGFDINCGMRLLVTNLTEDEVRPRIKQLVDRLFHEIPAGVGCKGFLEITRNDFLEVIEKGARWCVERGYGWEEDLELTEENNCIEGAKAACVSNKAIDRGYHQIGTLGSGNHYLEIQTVGQNGIFDKKMAEAMMRRRTGWWMVSLSSAMVYHLERM